MLEIWKAFWEILKTFITQWVPLLNNVDMGAIGTITTIFGIIGIIITIVKRR